MFIAIGMAPLQGPIRKQNQEIHVQIFIHLCMLLYVFQDWREVQEGENIYVHIADSHFCTAETNTTL